MMALIALATVGLLVQAHGAPSCEAHAFQAGTACACNASFCDEIALEWLDRIAPETAVVFTSNAEGLRLEASTLRVEDEREEEGAANSDAQTFHVQILSRDQDAQEMIGFGGAFTDAAAFVLGSLSNATRTKALHAYFSRSKGARYSLGRVPIGSSDFSRQSYSLMENASAPFALRDDRGLDGLDYKLDLILDALAIIRDTSDQQSIHSSQEDGLRVFGSVWSAPPWWKTCARPPAPASVNMCGTTWVDRILQRPPEPSYLLGGLDASDSTRMAYAGYIVNFLSAYANAGVDLWGLTAQNEPLGNPTGNKWENTNYEPSDLASFIENFLGPAVRAAFPRTKIMTGDDQFGDLLEHARFANASAFIDGVAFHWYQSLAARIEDSRPLPGQIAGGGANVGLAFERFSMLNRNLHGASQFLLATEACNGYMDNTAHPGSWARGYAYLRDIIHQVNNGAAGWTDWNLALDMRGGPNHAGNFVDAPILVDATRDVFYKQPMYYAMAHVSAFVPPGATRVRLDGVNGSFLGRGRALEAAAFRFGNGSDTRCVLVLANDDMGITWPLRTSTLRPRTVSLHIGKGRSLLVEIRPNEWKTIVFSCPPEPLAKFTLTDNTQKDSLRKSRDSSASMAVEKS
ncbi:Glucosylceramidase [Hondaea fermentalgiana]|uniref:Glucosylceramidase n=1 Tax=Hondaea fermentalgiana TaxID=2315210 RepID=A0A2R5GFF8_9STRA|nr:Glucosylceramidase [Hondaea fermentalgiana]|eukprot:GBG29650.1 Glucosylceramidase [Hondaea fermentalgiana]